MGESLERIGRIMRYNQYYPIHVDQMKEPRIRKWVVVLLSKEFPYEKHIYLKVEAPQKKDIYNMFYENYEIVDVILRGAK